MGFIIARNILDGVVIAQEVIHQNKKTEPNSFLLKLDFEKVSDMVDWECLLEVFHLKEFVE